MEKLKKFALKVNAVHLLAAVYFCWLSSIATLPGQTDPLRNYLQILEEQHPELVVNRLIGEERRIAVELADATRRPRVDVKSDYILAAGGRTIDFPIGDLFNPIYGTLNMLTGEERFPTDLENVNELLTPSNFHDTRVEITYPLLQPAIKLQRELRESQLRENEMEEAVIRNQLRLQFKQLYYAYAQSVIGQEILDSSRVVLEELVRVNRSLVANDLATRDVVYRAEAELADLNGQFAQLVEQELLAQAGLNQMLDREVATKIELGSKPKIDSVWLNTSLADWQSVAQNERPEKEQLNATAATLQKLSDLEGVGSKPTLGVKAQAGFQGFLSGDFSDHPYANIGIGFGWNIYDGKQRKLRQQQIAVQGLQVVEQRAATARRIDREVWTAYHGLRTSLIRLRAAKAGSRAATESFRITERRYRNQQAMLVEYLDARNRLTESQVNENILYYGSLQQIAAFQAAIHQNQ